jgi:hypothetical protein
MAGRKRHSTAQIVKKLGDTAPCRRGTSQGSADRTDPTHRTDGTPPQRGTGLILRGPHGGSHAFPRGIAKVASATRSGGGRGFSRAETW